MNDLFAIFVFVFGILFMTALVFYISDAKKSMELRGLALFAFA